MTITLTREEAQHVLYSLIFIKDNLKPSDPMAATSWHENLDPPIKTLRARLSAPEPEPVAWMHRQGNYTEPHSMRLDDDAKARGWTEEPLYTAPPQREWQGLTDEEIDAVGRDEWVGWPSYDGEFTKIYRVLEDKLKEKNDLATTKS